MHARLCVAESLCGLLWCGLLHWGGRGGMKIKEELRGQDMPHISCANGPGVIYPSVDAVMFAYRHNRRF